MKHILLFCNYFEGKRGNLEKCLNSFYKCKQNNDVIVGFIDNGSTDNSYEIAKKYIDNKFIDYYIFNTKNVGKAKALNSLLKYILINNNNVDNNTIIYSIDSDIQILDENLINNIDKLFTNNKDISLLSCEIISSDSEENYHYRFTDYEALTININGFDFYQIKRQDGFFGALYIMPLFVFLKVGMYNENIGKNKTSAIYGGDDAVLELKIYKAFPEMKNLICKSMKYFHPKTEDNQYKMWKVSQNRLMCTNGFGNSLLDDKGFYDK